MAKDKPYYPARPIGSVGALATCLGVSVERLQHIANSADASYKELSVITPTKNRTVFDPKLTLKTLQKRINSRIFSLVEFPEYLQGGIKDNASPRDYVQNSKLHAGAQSLICLDIKSFYDSIQVDDVRSIFKQFFRFPDDVSDLLIKICCRNNRVPQGACTSSYIANLVFHNSEYHVVSSLRSRDLLYSRLLDDVTISSKTRISSDDASKAIILIAKMFKKYRLRLNGDKTRVVHSADKDADFCVTGVWVKHRIPKLRKADRRYIRQLMYACRMEHGKDRSSSDYHKLWNRTSGQVAQMSRFGHHQAKAHRRELACLLPVYDEASKKKLRKEISRLTKVEEGKRLEYKNIRGYWRAVYRLGILSRTNPAESKRLRESLGRCYANAPCKREIWEA